MKHWIKTIILFLIISPIFAWAQPANYWTNSFNTEASLLSGAVVGGNAGITAVFYNPAAISDIKESRFDLNASLFNIEHKTYYKPLGDDSKMDNWSFRVFPRFTSYVYQSKRVENLTYQLAIFNRSSAKTEIYDRVQTLNPNLTDYYADEKYTGIFNLFSQYDDYWGSLGISKQINDKLSIGVAFNLSIQSLSYTRTSSANLSPINYQYGDTIPIISSTWQSYEKVKAYNWRFIGKIGLNYKHDHWAVGINITLPSMRLFGNANVNKTVSQTNIFYNNKRVPDYYLNEYPKFVYYKMQDPFSISAGLMYKDKSHQSEYYVTLEYYAPIHEYLAIDTKKETGSDSDLGSNFSSYNFGNKQILNIALGYKKMLNKKLGFLAGFRTDFNPYIMGYNENFIETNSFTALNINLYHLTGGIKFDYKQSSFIMGLQQSVGYKVDQEEFINFSNPEIYIPESGLALQGTRNNNMTYFYNSIGLYLGFSIVF